MHPSFAHLTVAAALVLGGQNAALAVDASPPGGWQQALEDAVLPAIGEVLREPIVEYTVLAQNVRHAYLEQADIDELDANWRAEREQDEQPLISATLANPTSSYLTRVQAHSLGLYTEIFIMDDKGLNVGQSNISSDFWQGDEAKFQETFGVGTGTVFIDEPEFRDDIGVWVVQVNATVDLDGAAIGAATFEVNLTELSRRRAALAAEG